MQVASYWCCRTASRVPRLVRRHPGRHRHESCRSVDGYPQIHVDVGVVQL